MAKRLTNFQIPQECIRFTFSRSSGPGGQNVNKLNTRVTLVLDISKCRRFSSRQKLTILEKLASRTNKNGCLHITCSRFRTQSANRKAAVEKLYSLLCEALKANPARKKSSSSAKIVEQRLRLKKKQSDLKKQRSSIRYIQD